MEQKRNEKEKKKNGNKTFCHIKIYFKFCIYKAKQKNKNF